jgi:hypothetical protein
MPPRARSRASVPVAARRRLIMLLRRARQSRPAHAQAGRPVPAPRREPGRRRQELLREVFG